MQLSPEQLRTIAKRLDYKGTREAKALAEQYRVLAAKRAGDWELDGVCITGRSIPNRGRKVQPKTPS